MSKWRCFWCFQSHGEEALLALDFIDVFALAFYLVVPVESCDGSPPMSEQFEQ